MKWAQKPLQTPDDAGFSFVWVDLELDLIAYEHLYPVQTHLAGQVREHRLVVPQLHAEHRIGKRLVDDPFNNLRFRHICA